MSNNIKKKIGIALIKIVCFVLVFLVGNKCLELVLLPYFDDDTHQSEQFYSVEKDSVDVMLVGASSILRGFSTNTLWESFGLTAEIRGSTSATPFISYLNIKEGLRYQNPKVIIVGINAMFGEYNLDDDNMEGAMRRALDYRKITPEKIETINTIVENSEEQTRLSYIFPILRYHDRWKEISVDSVYENLDSDKYEFLHGQRPRMETNTVEPRWGLMNKKESIEVNELSKEYYDKIIKLCKDEEIELIFVATPKEEWSLSKYEMISEYAKQNDVEYIDFNFDNILRECDIEWDKDFFDAGHLNAIGAEKVTLYLGRFIENNYDIKSEYSVEVQNKRNEDLKLYKEYLEEYF